MDLLQVISYVHSDSLGARYRGSAKAPRKADTPRRSARPTVIASIYNLYAESAEKDWLNGGNEFAMLRKRSINEPHGNLMADRLAARASRAEYGSPINI
jgi:hypothetical protein